MIHFIFKETNNKIDNLINNSILIFKNNNNMLKAN